MRIRVLISFVCIWISGCAATAPTYDPHATESLGRVVSKIPVGAKTQVQADSDNANGLEGVIGYVGVSIVNELVQKKTNITIYEYGIRMREGREVAVRTDFSTTKVGECVKVFESVMPTYPRFVSADGCEP